MNWAEFIIKLFEEVIKDKIVVVIDPKKEIK